MLSAAVRRRTLLLHGSAAGLIGAAAVALWFLAIDAIAGRPLFTPAALGSVIFLEVRDPAVVTVSLQPVALYTLVHVTAFLVTGWIAAVAVAEARKSPEVLWLLAEFFIVFEVGFYGVVAVLFAPLLAHLAWTNVAAGNLIAAGLMGAYFWRYRSTLTER